jgi:hypothetical protein
MAETIAINIGCGRDYRESWINLDNKQMYNGDFKVDIEADFLTYDREPESVDIILASHVIQYTPPDVLEGLLVRWYKWLRNGGAVYLEAGDVQKVCKNILEAKTIDELHGKNGIMQLYGIDNNIWNKWAWCPASVTTALNKAGYTGLFTAVGTFHHNPGRDFVCVGYKADENQAIPNFPYLLQTVK